MEQSDTNRLFKNKVEPEPDSESPPDSPGFVDSVRRLSLMSLPSVSMEPLRRLSVSLGFAGENEKKDESSLFSHMVLPIENYEVTSILTASQKEFCRRRCKNGSRQGSIIPKSSNDPVTAVLDMLEGEDEVRLNFDTY